MRIFSGNVKAWPDFLLTALTNDNFPEDRYDRLNNLFQNYDVVFLQEAFYGQEEIYRKSGFPFMEAPTFVSKGNYIVGSGLMILSRYPIEVIAQIPYEDCAPGTGDCYAAKGFSIVRIKDTCFIHTHADSGRQEPDQRMRAQQFSEISRAIQNMDCPFILVGDTNLGHAIPKDIQTQDNFMLQHNFKVAARSPDGKKGYDQIWVKTGIDFEGHAIPSDNLTDHKFFLVGTLTLPRYTKDAQLADLSLD